MKAPPPGETITCRVKFASSNDVRVQVVGLDDVVRFEFSRVNSLGGLDVHRISECGRGTPEEWEALGRLVLVED